MNPVLKALQDNQSDEVVMQAINDSIKPFDTGDIVPLHEPHLMTEQQLKRYKRCACKLIIQEVPAVAQHLAVVCASRLYGSQN